MKVELRDYLGGEGWGEGSQKAKPTKCLRSLINPVEFDVDTNKRTLCLLSAWLRYDVTGGVSESEEARRIDGAWHVENPTILLMILSSSSLVYLT